MSLSYLKKRDIVLRQLSEIPQNAQLIFFRSPAEFSRLFYERVNPDHVGLVWGQRVRKLRKKHGKALIRVCKVKISGVSVIMRETLSELISPFAAIVEQNLASLGLFICFCYLCFALLFCTTIFNIPKLEAKINAMLVK